MNAEQRPDEKGASAALASTLASLLRREILAGTSGDRIEFARDKDHCANAQLAHQVDKVQRPTCPSASRSRMDCKSLGIAVKSADQILQRWRRSDFAWFDDPPRRLEPTQNARVLAVFESPNADSSGRLMWNMGMWLDFYWCDLDSDTRRRVLNAIESIMLTANHNRAHGLWKIGESLGEHIATQSCRRVLENVVESASSTEAIDSALHGLAHFAYNRPNSRDDVCDNLANFARRQSRFEFSTGIRNTIRGIRHRNPCGRIA